MRPLFVVAAIIGCSLVTVTAARPDKFHYQWTVEVKAPVDVVERQIVDLNRWVNWSPYDRLDHDMQRTVVASEVIPAASLAWSGDDRVGAGRVALTRATPRKVVLGLILVDRPVRTASLTTFSLANPRPGITEVTWQVDGRASLQNRLLMGLGVFEGHVRGKLIVGMQTLKDVVEAEAAATDRVSAAPAVPAN